MPTNTPTPGGPTPTTPPNDGCGVVGGCGNTDNPPCILQTDFTFKCHDDPGAMNWGDIRLTTSAVCARNTVMRNPYPRTLVNIPVNFKLLLDDQYRYGPSKTGNWTAPASPSNIDSTDLMDTDGTPKLEGLYREMKIGLRARRLDAGEPWFGYKAITPTWTFNTGANGERVWNPSKSSDLVQKNVTATFTYQTSSAGLATGGREFDSNAKAIANSYNLPAYQVQLETACGFEWAMDWKVSVKDTIVKDPPTAPCFTPDATHPSPAIAATNGCPTGQVATGKWKYKWETKKSNDCGDGVMAVDGWCGMDLKYYKLTTSGFPYLVVKGATEGGVFKGSTYWSPSGAGIKVPVVEVQTVMREACVANGTCSPLTAPGSSLTP